MEPALTQFPVRNWAKVYRDRGLAVARIVAGEKRPTDKAWTRRSCQPGEFRTGDGIGLMTGALSGNLVCIDLDCREALRLADQWLPATGMVGGREGKPRSHRYFIVTDLQPDLLAAASVAGSAGGPRIRHFKRPDGVTILDLLGTGAQAVEATSIWVSPDTSRRESRVWNDFRAPAVVKQRELYEAAADLARECGYVEKSRPAARKRHAVETLVLPVPAMPVGESARQARSYLASVPAAEQGKGGDACTFCVACRLVRDFDLSRDEAWPLLLEYNSRCVPPWSERELFHKLACAEDWEGDPGERLRESARHVEVRVRPDDSTVYVGLDCAAAGRSYVLLEPALWAGFVKLGEERELAPGLERLTWEGKEVVLTPASTITTNKGEVWDQFWMADLLRRKGARVVSLLLPPLDGRRRTLSQAGDAAVEVVEPPLTAREAHLAAREASMNAQETDSVRRALPRKKASKKLDAAVAWLEKRKPDRLDKKTFKAARRTGHSEGTVRRALQVIKNGRKQAKSV